MNTLDDLFIKALEALDQGELEVLERHEKMAEINEIKEPEKQQKKGLGPGTVRNFLLVLGSKITQQDQREAKAAMKRGSPVNIYALGLLLAAKRRVDDDMRGREGASDDHSLLKLVASMRHHFIPSYPPVKNVEKQISAWLTNKKQPSLVG
jgi:hypothetical protein